ncbi:hypothetical protein [Paraburkholderia tropica]|uniref:hypothetical protein n=1 Tax=Paraburkholderia tropica TaxID=92647 RepID=UPI002ABE4118|nr:hypothetical protein [Paraburkholderia tropica]
MNPVIESAVVTVNLCSDDLNRELADVILLDCRSANEPSSYRTNANEIFVQPELMTGEPCLVVPLPGMLSTEAPPSDESPSAIILRERRDGKGDTYLKLRGGNVRLLLNELDGGARYLVLYLFDDCVSLDLIAITEELMEDIWVHDMSAQSRHLFDDEPLKEATRGTFDVPLYARRAITITRHETASMASPDSK